MATVYTIMYCLYCGYTLALHCSVMHWHNNSNDKLILKIVPVRVLDYLRLEGGKKILTSIPSTAIIS